MAERFANERINMRLKSRQIQSLEVLFLLFWGVWSTPAKTAMKAENHSKKVSINTTVGTFLGFSILTKKYLEDCALADLA